MTDGFNLLVNESGSFLVKVVSFSVGNQTKQKTANLYGKK